ncbi:endonuclease domain-containing protein [Streptomyces tendae]|uniref:endonuclease domain-containing protein n=2 Tax=Streptomyces tendae TaxID=1932 RepID=UPI0036752A59
MKVCRAEGDGWACGRSSVRYPLTQGLCKTHYAQLRKRGIMAPINPERASAEGRTCDFRGCERAVSARRLCTGHYQQQRSGQPLAPLKKKRGNGAIREMVQLGAIECLHCRQCKPLSEFSKLNASGVPRPYCKPCNAERVRLRHYNVTREFVEQLLLIQEGKCAICGAPAPAEVTMHIDHDHACCPVGRSCGACVRGLLCNRCNYHGLGWYEALPPELRTFGLLNSYLSLPPARRLRMEMTPPAAA